MALKGSPPQYHRLYSADRMSKRDAHCHPTDPDDAEAHLDPDDRLEASRGARPRALLARIPGAKE